MDIKIKLISSISIHTLLNQDKHVTFTFLYKVLDTLETYDNIQSENLKWKYR